MKLTELLFSALLFVFFYALTALFFSSCAAIKKEVPKLCPAATELLARADESCVTVTNVCNVLAPNQKLTLPEICDGARKLCATRDTVRNLQKQYCGEQ